MVDDDSSVTSKITLILQGLSQSSHGVAETLPASRTDHYASAFGDKGWGCGFRNLQMILSTLLHSTLYREVVLAAVIDNRNLVAVRSGGVPSILRLQQVIEEAWRAGFDRAGCEQPGGRLVNSRKWIGTTEVATFLWVSKGKLLPCWWVLLFSTVFNFDNSWERFVGACSHCATALSLAAVIPGNTGEFTTTHRGVRLLDRKNPEQMDINCSWKKYYDCNWIG